MYIISARRPQKVPVHSHTYSSHSHTFNMNFSTPSDDSTNKAPSMSSLAPRPEPSVSVLANGCFTKIPAYMRSVQVDDSGVTRVQWHCAKDAPADTVCTIAGCGHDFSEAGVITYCQGKEDSVTYQVGDKVWGMRAKDGPTSCSTVLKNSKFLILGDFSDTLYAKNGWEKPRLIPQVDELRRLEEANSSNDGSDEETLKAEDVEQEDGAK